MRGVVLNRFRHGESSSILKLLSDEHGLIGVYVPGAMKKKGIPEIGDLVEGEPKRRRSDGLYSLYQLVILEKYSFPAYLTRMALRDIAFEVIWRFLPEEDVHSALFQRLILFLEYLRSTINNPDKGVFALWLFLYRFTEESGIALSLSQCSRCGTVDRRVGVDSFGELICDRCMPTALFFPLFLNNLMLGKGTITQIGKLSNRETYQTTALFVTYIKIHFNYKGSFSTLQFLKELLL